MSKLLINATQAEELRVVIIDEQGKICDLDTERPESKQKKSNIYKGKIARIEPSLGAVFVDYGSERHGFLPIKEISKFYFLTQDYSTETQLDITKLVEVGQEIMIQVTKEERGSKGAALTTFISLAGSYLVLMPNNPRAGGISRRIEGKERDDLRVILNQLKIPEDMGIIVRTAGVNKTKEELQWDLDTLLHHWSAILEAYKAKPAPFLIHQESNAAIRAIRDYLRPDITEIIIDTQPMYEQIKNYIEQTKPDFCERIKLYRNKTPIFSYYHIEKQIETAYQRSVTLPSGGSIVIDPTEALVSIDVNSAKATVGKNIEETALLTNLEAAVEIAKQLKLRDIGGLIVIDFIDMLSVQNQYEVANKLREALRTDRARVRIGNITRFGLMEMSRQRLSPYLGESIQIICPRCDGQGTIRSTKSLAMTIIRLLEEDATQEKIVQIQAQLPIELATYILNEQKDAVQLIEQRHDVKIFIIPNQYLQTPKYKIKKFRANELPRGGRSIDSHKLLEMPKTEIPLVSEKISHKQPEQPAVATVFPAQPAPIVKPKSKLLGWLKSLFAKPATIPKESHQTKRYYAPRKKYYRHKPQVRGHSKKY